MTIDEMVTLPSIRDHVVRASNAATMLMRDVLDRELAKIIGGTDSPIEAAFAIWWEMLDRMTGRLGHVSMMPQWEFPPIRGKKYRADFVVWPSDTEYLLGSPYRPIIVELDGHEFHERTKEQVAYRNERDRAFQDEGYLVLHYSGSELHSKSLEVVSEVLSVALEECAKHATHVREFKADPVRRAAHEQRINDRITQTMAAMEAAK